VLYCCLLLQAEAKGNITRAETRREEEHERPL
jgi:hypothetical protein